MARTQQKFGHGIGIGERISIGNICRSLDVGSIQDALAATCKKSLRKRDFPADLVIYYVIAMALFMHVNLREVLFCLMEGLRLERGVKLKVTGKSRISQARSRIDAELRRLRFGRSSEKLDHEIELMIDELEEGRAQSIERTEAAKPASAPRKEKLQPVRKPLPDHLPRERVYHEAACISCDSTYDI